MAYTVTSVLERPNTGVSWFDLASKTDVRNEMKSFIDNKKTEDHIGIFCCLIYGGKRANEYKRHCKWI